KSPLRVGQNGRITKAATIGQDAMLRLPHPQLPCETSYSQENHNRLFRLNFFQDRLLDSTLSQQFLLETRKKQSAAGKASGRKRKENRVWVGPATELAIRARDENPSFGRSKIADFMLEYSHPDQRLPGHPTLMDFVKKLEESGVIPRSIKRIACKNW
ncbi:MAG: hypothetical protein AB7P43_16850, partial [Methylocystis sp.]|uniref:hypothetical protein n=1 Tax=Methylocystis sp. TaxID=1911079 RepID=UPI003D14D2DA